MDNSGLIFPFLLLLFLCAFFGWAVGKRQMDEKWEKEAVSRGHAEYALVGPEIKFRWKEKP